MTVSEWIDIWFETKSGKWKKPTRDHRKGIMTNYVKPLIGRYKLATLDRTTYEREFINVMLQKLKPRTVNLYHQTFMIAVNAAVQDEYITRNRFSGMSVETGKNDPPFLTAKQLNVLLSAVKEKAMPTHNVILHLLAYTGLRVGEVLGLTWEEIDPQNKTVTVLRTRDARGIREPKTLNSYRTVLIDQQVIDMLMSYKTWTKAQKLRHGIRHSEKDFAFISSRGTAITYSAVRDYLRCFIRRNDLDIPKITPHALRHSHAALLLSQGLPVHDVAERLGNTADMVMKVYGYAIDDLKVESVTLFANALNL